MQARFFCTENCLCGGRLSDDLQIATTNRNDTPRRGGAPYTFPRGEGGTAIAVTDEECGRKPNERQTLPGFFPHPVFRRSSPVFFVPPASVRKIHPPPGGGYRRAVNDRPYKGSAPKGLSLRGAKRRGNLPVQFYGRIGTDVEATPHREIPTDGTAVLGMT